jgi:hypothetical protein
MQLCTSMYMPIISLQRTQRTGDRIQILDSHKGVHGPASLAKVELTAAEVDDRQTVRNCRCNVNLPSTCKLSRSQLSRIVNPGRRLLHTYRNMQA